MPTQVQIRRGTTAQHSTFTGAAGELTVDTDKKTVVVHDASTAGGLALLREDGSNSALALGSASAPSLKFTGDTNTGIFSPGADRWAVTTGGSQRVEVDASGRVLVGTSSASNNLRYSEKLAVVNTSADWTGISITNYPGTTAGHSPLIELQRSRGTTDGSMSAVGNGDSLGQIVFRGATGSAFETAANISCEVDGGVSGAGDIPGRLVFSTTADGASSPTERVRIGGGGRSLDVYSTGTETFSVGISSGAGTTNALITGGHTASGIFNFNISYRVWSNGNVQNTNGSFTALSDAKLKENIVDAKSQWNDLKAIKIRNWNFKVETGHETHRQIGPIAQELEQVCPGLVFETPDRDKDGNDLGTTTKGVNQSVLYMKAVKALQEAMERIETLEAEVAALKAQ